VCCSAISADGGGGSGGGPRLSFDYGVSGATEISDDGGGSLDTYAQPTPPTPPPPQDCYAGPRATCVPPPPPQSLLRTPLITAKLTNITSFAKLCKQGDCINETDKDKQGPVKGTTPGSAGSTGNAVNTDAADQNDQQLLQLIDGQGVQPTPAAGGTAGGSNIGGRGNNACDEPVGNSKEDDYQFEQIAASFEGISKIS